MIGIYCIKNIINNKIYVGKSECVEKRIKYHNLKLNSNNHKNIHLQNAWNKYGDISFIFEILEECDKNELNNKEIEYINKYNSANMEFGYNLTLGGDGGIPTEEIRKKMSDRQKGEKSAWFGKNHSDKTKNKISTSHIGKMHSQETKNKLRQIHLGKKISEEAKIKLRQYKKTEQQKKNLSIKNSGENNGRSKIGIKDVNVIKRLYGSKKYSMEYISKIYGISDSQIFNIIHEISWKSNGGKMNIKDYVKFDERSEKIINQKYDRKIDLLDEKFDGLTNSIVYLDEKQTILDKKAYLIDRLKKSNCPVRDESLLIEMAIAWAEANGYTSFTRAMREVINEVAEDGKTFDGNLLEDDKHADITLEEAKEIFKNSNSNISDAFFNESLKVYKRSLRSWDETVSENHLDISDWKCSITIDGKECEIPVMILKQIIASASRMDFSTDPQKYIKELRAIKIPDMRLRWPKE